MSYCRFSCDDFQCDLYVYESTYGGFCTVVAQTRVVYPEQLPAPVPLSIDNMEQWKNLWLARHKAICELLGRAKRETITLPHAGKQFFDETLEELQERLQMLKALGYRYPEKVDALIREELRESSNSLAVSCAGLQKEA